MQQNNIFNRLLKIKLATLLTGTTVDVPNGVSGIFFVLLLNQIAIFLQIVLQNKYNISLLTVKIEFACLGTKRLERLAKSLSFPRF
jgi:hypothetical protein